MILLTGLEFLKSSSSSNNKTQIPPPRVDGVHVEGEYNIKGLGMMRKEDIPEDMREKLTRDTQNMVDRMDEIKAYQESGALQQALAQPLHLDDNDDDEDSIGSSEEDDDSLKVALVRLANVSQNPTSTNPAFMICCAFRTPEERSQHYQECKDTFDRGGATWNISLNEWFVCCSSIAKQRDPHYTSQKRDKLLKIYKEKFIKDHQEWKENVTEKKMGKTKESLFKILQKKQENRTTRVQALKHKFKSEGRIVSATSLPASAQIQNQCVALASFLPDITPESLNKRGESEPLCMIYGLFGSDDEAAKYKKDNLDSQVTNFDIDIVKTNEWLFPENVDANSIEEEYRNEKVNQIMQRRKINRNSKIMKIIANAQESRLVGLKSMKGARWLKIHSQRDVWK